MTVNRIILIRGLVEPQCVFWPLRRVLKKHCGRVDIFRDRILLRNTEASIERLSRLIVPEKSDDTVGIVSHSFGDWIARQAIARTPDHGVRRLISVTPALELGWLTAAFHLATGGVVPELKIIADRQLARANLELEPSLRRTVIWSKIDCCVRPIALAHVAGVDVFDVWATHMTAVMQPNVVRLIARGMA